MIVLFHVDDYSGSLTTDDDVFFFIRISVAIFIFLA